MCFRTCLASHILVSQKKHEYSTIVGIQESVEYILMNMKEIVLRSIICMKFVARLFVSRVLDL
jgi:DNA-directed RNA polymerase alpha subunit